MNRFEGKVVVVTGASSGIGEATAARFAEEGARVFGVARRKEAAEEKRKQRPAIQWLVADVTDAVAITGAIESVVREAGRLDVLVNNAGTGTFGPLEASDPEMILRQYETNVFGPIHASRAALPALRSSRGTIVNVGSAAGRKALAGGAVYGSTKAALEHLTRSWALELAPAGVRVNLVSPGPTDTPVFEKLGVPKEHVGATKEAFVKQVPLGRMAAASEIALWIVGLAAPDAVWVTGAVIDADGGMSLT